MNKSKPTKTDWEKGFDVLMIGYACDAKPYVKAFIIKLRQQVVEETLEAVEEGLSQCYVVYDNADYQKKLEQGYLIEEVKELLAELKKKEAK